jgi:hypothetical protein
VRAIAPSGFDYTHYAPIPTFTTSKLYSDIMGVSGGAEVLYTVRFSSIGECKRGGNVDFLSASYD